MNDFAEKALKLHEKNGGKLSVESMVPLNNKEDLSVAYTPGVAAVSRAIAKDPSLLYTYGSKGNLVAVLSDGSAVLGLGNVGPEAAYPVMEGKALLFKKFGHVNSVPLVLDTQDPDEIVKIAQAIAPGFGGINLEDIAAPACFEILERLQKSLKIPVFHDDQHGTAIVCLAGLINAMKVVGKKKDLKIVINGAGAAGMAITQLLHHYGFSNLFLLDSKACIYKGRADLNPYKAELAEHINPQRIQGSLEDLMQGADAFIGVSKGGLVSQAMVRSMAQDAIVFAMANPDPEISELDAKAAGAKIVATGRSDSNNQLNNVLVFPGLFRGALDARIEQFNTSHFIAAAEALAGMVPSPSAEKIIPSPFEPGVAEAIAQVLA